MKTIAILVATFACAPIAFAQPNEALQSNAPSENSIFLLEGQWSRHDGTRVALDHVRGHVTVVLMFYGTCQAVCSLLIQDVTNIDAALSPVERARVRYLLVSLDPAHDTVLNLAALATAHELDRRYSLLRGTPDQVRELAAVLDVRYRVLPDGQFRHSNVITLLDHEGQIAFRVEGVGVSPEPMVNAIRALTANRGVHGG